MAKLSLSNVLYNRRRMNYLTLLCCLILVFFLGSILIAKNPNKTKAGVIKSGNSYTIDSSNGCKIYNLWGDGSLPGYTGQQIEYTCVSSVYYPLPENADLIITDAGVVVTTYSLPGQPVKVNSLTITNKAKLTHKALSVADAIACDSNGNGSILDSTDVSNAQCISARSQKVDITATTSITLSLGGNINVYEKGYTGGAMSVGGSVIRCLTDPIPANQSSPGIYGAFGPGRGGRCMGNMWGWSDDTNGKSGIGGSFAGLGNRSFGLVGANEQGTYNYLNPSSSEVEFGSGGQAIAYDNGSGDFAGGTGGAGGGRVRLKTNTLTIMPTSYISADGGFGTTGTYTGIDITPGGGSGGAVVIDATSIDMTAAKNSTAPAVTDQVPDKFITTAAGGKNATWGNLDDSTGIYGSSHYGSDGVIRVINTSADLYQISAQGGRACGHDSNKYCSIKKDNAANSWTKIDGSGGGGGWIVVQSSGDVSGVSINKSLSPVSRTDGTTIFNPYALKMGDIIAVNLEVYNMTPGNTYTVTDEALATSVITNGQKCGIIASSQDPINGLITGDSIGWPVVSGPTGQAQLIYQCKVQ